MHMASRHQWRDRLRQAPLALSGTDLGLALIILVAPFFMAGRQAFGQLVLCILACFTAFCWAIHQCRADQARWRFTGTEPFLLLGIALVAVQTLQIPSGWVELVSPQIAEFLPLWRADSEIISTTWNSISLTPADTLSNLIVVVACVLVFLVAVQRIRTPDDVRRILQAIALCSIVMAGFGILQFLFGNGKFFWRYEHPFTDTRYVAKGAFTNANHFANFLAVSVPIQLWLIVRELPQGASRHGRRSRSWGSAGRERSVSIMLLIWTVGLLITGLAILLSMSRGGIVFTLLGVLVTLLLFWRKSLLGPQVAFVVTAVAALSLGATLFFGDLAIKMVEQNFVELTDSDVSQLDQNNARRKIWNANLAGIQDFPILGTGLGSHREVYWHWFNHPHDGAEYSHAESGYLQVALETGLIGLGLVCILWLFVGGWCLRGIFARTSGTESGAIITVTAGLLVNLAHSVTDFVWYAPACMIVTLLLACCAWRLSRRESEHAESTDVSQNPVPHFGPARLAWGAALPAILLCGWWMTDHKLAEVRAEPLWFEYLRLVTEEADLQTDDLDAETTLLRRRLDLVKAAAAANPRAHRVRFHAGIAEVARFALVQQEVGQGMPLDQIREAARASFPNDPEGMSEWLNKPGVLGEARRHLSAARDHFWESLRLCPVQSRPYLELADLLWLEGVSDERANSIVRQALAARPYDARGHFTLGLHHWRLSLQSQAEVEVEVAIRHWKEAFRLDSEFRGRLIESLAAYLPAAFFLDHFEPDREALRQLRSSYAESADASGRARILEQLGKESAKHALRAEGLQAEKDWLEAHECFAELGNDRATYHSAKEALRVNPSSYQAHLKLGLWLYEKNIHSEAQEHLEWCARHKPEIAWLQTFAEDSRGRVELSDANNRRAQQSAPTIRR